MTNHALVDRGTVVEGIRRAIAEARPYAAGKLGTSEKYWMYYEALLASGPSRLHRIAYESGLKYHALGQSGLFPADLEFIRAFNREYVADVRSLDSVGMTGDRPDLEDGVVGHYGLVNPFTAFVNQEPDRSVPARDDECYLPALKGKKLLLVCPFAHLLRERATYETFDRVWAKTGKRWCGPAVVDSLEFPYGFDASTRERFGNALALRDAIVADIARRDFDVALIAAGGLGIPLAAAAKRLGKVGISLGGHLQVLFGVLGKRWRDQPEWMATYVNDAWIDMPERYRPELRVVDDGAYW